MILIYNIFNRLVNKIKKLFIVAISGILLLLVAMPLIINFYVEHQYCKISKNITSKYPGVAISHEITRKYLNSIIVTKLYTNKTLLVLEHNIKPTLFLFDQKNIMANIQTKILSGMPGFLKQQEPIFALTTVDTKNHINTKINPLIFEYIFDFDIISSIKTLVNVNINANDNELGLYINVPTLNYAEDSLKAQIQDIKFVIKKINNDVKLSTNIDRIYITKDLQPIMRLVDFKMQHKLINITSQHGILDNIVSFAKLNIHEQYFGPLSTRVQLTNINFPIMLDPINYIINNKQVATDNINIMDHVNKLLAHKPILMVDLLVKTDGGKVKLLSDFSVPHGREVDVFNKTDFLDSLQANISANIPKKIFFELSRLILQEKLKRENTIVTYSGKKRGNITKETKQKDFYQQLDAMVVERVGYLLKQNIIKEHENNFILDIAVAEGTFYSRLNPFKLFSFM